MHTAWTRALALLALAGCDQEYQVIHAPVDVDPGDIAECGFSPISGTKLSVYDCNPVFTGASSGNWGEGFISTGFRTQELLGHPFYQIWYSAGPPDSDNWGLGYAISSNGTDWEDHPDNPLVKNKVDTWDQDRMDGIQIIWDETRKEYVLWYQGFRLGDGFVDPGDWGIGIKTSPDGVAWSNLKGNGMVLNLANQIKGVDYCWPLGVTWNEGNGYSGYLAGGPQPAVGQYPVCQVYRFVGKTLDDPSSFEFTDKPMLKAGPQNYDKSGMASVAVVEWEEGEWYMFYVGFSDWTDEGNVITSTNPSLNLATSTDGLTWTKSDDNPLPVNLANPRMIRDVAAQKYGSRILLWVTDRYEDIGQMAVGFYMFEPDSATHP